jgi:hypothetical protein
MADKEVCLLFPLLVKLCSDKLSFEARTQKRLCLNMNKAKRNLEGSEEHKIVVHTPHMIIFRTGKAEITLSKDGRMLIRKVPDEKEATRLARQTLRTILE